MHYREIRLTGTTACSSEDCRRAAALLESGRIELSGLVSRRFHSPRPSKHLLLQKTGARLK
jgi:threonine dehydrogenase-like Zn-dependent dehydrogenase